MARQARTERPQTCEDVRSKGGDGEESQNKQLVWGIHRRQKEDLGGGKLGLGHRTWEDQSPVIEMSHITSSEEFVVI